MSDLKNTGPEGKSRGQRARLSPLPAAVVPQAAKKKPAFHKSSSMPMGNSAPSQEEKEDHLMLIHDGDPASDSKALDTPQAGTQNAKKMASLLLMDFDDTHSEDEMDDSQLQRRRRTYRRWARMTHVLRERIVNDAFGQQFIVAPVGGLHSFDMCRMTPKAVRHVPKRRTTLFGTILGRYVNKIWWEGALSKRANFGFLGDTDFGQDVAADPAAEPAAGDQEQTGTQEQSGSEVTLAPEIQASTPAKRIKGGRRRSSVTMEFFMDPEKGLMEVMQEIYNPEAVTGEENEFYTDQALLQREALQYDPDVRAQLDQIWSLIDEDSSGGLDKFEYKKMHRLMVHVLLGGSMDEDKASLMAEDDWDVDRDGYGVLNRKRFGKCWFTLADRYTDAICSKEYTEFLGFMYREMFKTVKSGIFSNVWRRTSYIPHLDEDDFDEATDVQQLTASSTSGAEGAPVKAQIEQPDGDASPSIMDEVHLKLGAGTIKTVEEEDEQDVPRPSPVLPDEVEVEEEIKEHKAEDRRMLHDLRAKARAFHDIDSPSDASEDEGSEKEEEVVHKHGKEHINATGAFGNALEVIDKKKKKQEPRNPKPVDKKCRPAQGRERTLRNTTPPTRRMSQSSKKLQAVARRVSRSAISIKKMASNATAQAAGETKCMSHTDPSSID
jgi:hypothetical protein